MEKDSYVLCRIFLKNNIGPPSANRYAPFMEEEWDDGKAAMPGEDVRDDFVAVDYACDERNDVEPMHVEQVCTTSFFCFPFFLFCSSYIILHYYTLDYMIRKIDEHKR